MTIETGFDAPFTPPPCGPQPMSRCIHLRAADMGAVAGNSYDAHTVWEDFNTPSEAEAFGNWAYAQGLNARYSRLHADSNRIMVRDMTTWPHK